MVKLKPVPKAFGKTQTPTIACFNRAKTELGVDYDKLIDALQVYVDKHVAPVWATPAKLAKTEGFVEGWWALVFLDKSDEPGDEGYHDLTPDGFPQSNVFVKTTRDSGDLVSVSASHELVEMLVDPSNNMMTTGPNPKIMYAYESADPVEELSFKINGIPMSDFVYPSYFEVFRKPKSVPFDRMGKVKEPFEVLAGGYQIRFSSGRWWNRYGSLAKRARFEKEDRTGHRSESRGKPLKCTSLEEIAASLANTGIAS